MQWKSLCSALVLSVCAIACEEGMTAEEEHAIGACCVVEKLCSVCSCADFEEDLWVQNDDVECSSLLDAQGLGCDAAEKSDRDFNSECGWSAYGE